MNLFQVMFTTGGRIHEACVTLRENIDLKRGRIIVPPEAQKGKPRYDDQGKLVNRPYAKQQVFDLKNDDGILTLLRQAEEGLTDDRDVKKNYKKPYTLPKEGYIFRGSAQIAKAKKAAEDNDESALKFAMAEKPISTGAVDANIQKVKNYLLQKDEAELNDKKEEIDEKVNAWIALNNPTDEGKKQFRAEVEMEYRKYDWVKNVSSHSFKRSGCTILSGLGYTSDQIRHGYSRHTSGDAVSAYIADTKRDEVRANANSLIGKHMKQISRKRVSSDDSAEHKKACTSPATSSTMSDILNDYDSDSD